ncbi:DUF4917 family protein [Pseudomonas typographi]|uniref:DUF4917 family protein n=1 Tax=Pseudomonas typographi TaxID=2715964 RepID=A0ABR7YWD3_9PSED|nr:DUF4917 family protein [Pseudomonas typographi]MBD1597492.1 DUF4917 family protein [Pseudomonas typographi]
MATSDLNATLPTWAALAEAQACTGLLLGNGASRAVWRTFNYPSLFERAQQVRNRPLAQTDLALFKALGTESFTQVLVALGNTARVNAALTISSTAPLNRYYSIKEALIHAVRSLHITWQQLNPANLAAINRALRHYRTVYSSNYDLLCHWAVWHNMAGFDDLMDPDDGFDARRLASSATRVLYLHGGLHLVRNRDGSTRQRAAGGSELLDGFAINTPGDVPLLVNEGHSEDKLRTIGQNAYLSAALQQLATHRGALCVFGHQLGTQDAHLVHAVRSARPERIAVSIFPLSDAWVISQKAHYRSLLGDVAALSFFDATSHPLGAPGLLHRPG